LYVGVKTISKLVEQMDLAECVGKEHLKGKNATQIARELQIPRKDVTVALENFRGLLRRNAESAVSIRDRLMDIIFESDEAFRMVIEQAWDTVDQADAAGQLNHKVNALNLIKSATKDRSDMLQKSGMSQDEELIDQLNEAEHNQGVLVDLLKEIRDNHPEVAELISRKLSQVRQGGEVTVESIESGEHAGAEQNGG